MKLKLKHNNQYIEKIIEEDDRIQIYFTEREHKAKDFTDEEIQQLKRDKKLEAEK